MKNRVVSKKELEASGLSLRDFLNKERGLTRKAPEGTKAGEYKPRRSPEAATATVKPGTNVNYENADATSETFKKGGKASSASKRADGIAQRGKTRA
jgi:plastocyanin